MSIFIMLDVGGTEIKGGVFDVSGALLGGIRNFQAKAGENPDTIFENFCHIISDLGGGFPKEKLVDYILQNTRKPYPAANLCLYFSKRSPENGIIGAAIEGFRKL